MSKGEWAFPNLNIWIALKTRDAPHNRALLHIAIKEAFDFLMPARV